MNFDPGFDILTTANPMGFAYGPDVFGPEIEMRSLDAIRPSLLNQNCDGPDPVYAIAMDIGTNDVRDDLFERNLLYGAVTYAAGSLGNEPVRSQGHVHAASLSCGASTAELYEIWSGRAVILMQESDSDDPGRCFAVEAGVGDLVVVPPGWAHATISADRAQPLTFGAWCVRDYGFSYTGIRAHHGLAWFAQVGPDGGLDWRRNPAYPFKCDMKIQGAREYAELGLKSGIPIYSQYRMNPERLMWVPRPELHSWESFVP